MLRGGSLLVVDYIDAAAGLIARGADGWLRTYRGHERGGPPLDAPGEQDITADIVREQLTHAARAAGFAIESDVTQAEWLRDLGIDELAESGRRTWEARAHVGDLEAHRRPQPRRGGGRAHRSERSRRPPRRDTEPLNSTLDDGLGERR